MMAFCELCDEPVKIISENNWTGEKHPEADRLTRYACINDECTNDGGEVWATESGVVIHEVGVW